MHAQDHRATRIVQNKGPFFVFYRVVREIITNTYESCFIQLDGRSWNE